MFRKVIVGVDEHQGGRDAAALANELVSSDGSLTLARVLIREALIGRNASPHSEASERAGLAYPKRAVDELPGQPPVRSIEASSVGRGLHELAEAEQADLLVVGSCRRGLLGRVMLGDETNDALNGAPCALAIAPYGYAQRPAVLTEIGVAYNGSPESDDALAVARALADEHGARLSAFETVSVPASVALPGAGAAVELLPALVDEARERIAALGGVEPHAAYGVPAEELALYGASLDLLVIGSRSYGPVGRVMHGSTSRQLAHTARCPMLVLTRGSRTGGQASLDHAARAAAPVAVG